MLDTIGAARFTGFAAATLNTMRVRGGGPRFHHGTNLNVRARNGTGWKCFKCGEWGDGIDLIRRLRYPEMPALDGRVAALRYAASKAGVALANGREESSLSKWALRTDRDQSAVADHPSWHRPEAAAESSEVRRMLRESHAAMHLGAGGRAYLIRRGFDTDDAQAFGVRSLESDEDWRMVRSAMSEFTTQERDLIGLMRMPFKVPDAVGGWGYVGPLLVILYHEPNGLLVSWRMRALVEGALGFDGSTARRYKDHRNAPREWPFGAAALANVGGKEVHVAEGELNAYSLMRCGHNAIGIPGANSWHSDWIEYVPDVRRVVTWFDDDDDDAGRAARKFLRDAINKRLGAKWRREHYREVTPKTKPWDRLDVNDAFVSGDLAAYISEAKWNE